MLQRTKYHFVLCHDKICYRIERFSITYKKISFKKIIFVRNLGFQDRHDEELGLSSLVSYVSYKGKLQVINNTYIATISLCNHLDMSTNTFGTRKTTFSPPVIFSLVEDTQGSDWEDWLLMGFLIIVHHYV